MSYSFKRSVIGIGVAAAAVAAVSMLVPLTRAQAGFRASRFVDGRPDLNGFWQAVGAAHWDIEAHHAQPGPPPFGALFSVPAGLGVVEGGDIPYQPWALPKRRENFEKRWALDPETKCYMPGVPRATYMPFPFQIIQSTSRIMMVYEYAASQRTILMDTAKPSPAPTWMGHSLGRWEGDTLVVDVTRLHADTWFDRAGNFHSEALHVVERYTPSSPYHLDYEVTIEDPKVFTRPWKMRMPLYRRQDKNMQLLEFRCVPFSEELLYGDLRAPAAR
jgi:hypothetical protein